MSAITVDIENRGDSFGRLLDAVEESVRGSEIAELKLNGITYYVSLTRMQTTLMVVNPRREF